MILSEKTRKQLIAVVIASLIIVLLSLLKRFPSFIESKYSNLTFPLITSVLHLIFNYIPISIGDLIYIIAVCLIVFGLVKFIKLLFGKNFKKTAHFTLKALFILEIGIIIFYLFWGLNYFREPASKRYSLPKQPYTTNELTSVLNLLIDSANLYRSKLSSEDFNVTNSSIFNAAIIDIKQSPVFTIHSHIQVKNSIFSEFLNYSAISGYYNPFTGETQINKTMPVFLKPFVSLHELSHQVGIAAEDEANFTGFLTGISSPSNLTKYSCYYLAVQEFLYELKAKNLIGFYRIQSHISTAVLKDFETERIYWLKYKGQLNQLTGFLYDNFLKANNQPEGLKTYNRMISLTMAFYKKKGFY